VAAPVPSGAATEPARSAETAPYRLAGADFNTVGDYGLRVAPDGLRADAAGLPVATLRATYRYTWVEGLSWAGQVGLTTRIDDPATLRAGALAFGLGAATLAPSAPRLHLAAGGQVFAGMNWAVETDSLLRRRGAAFDLGLRVDYGLAPGLNVFGGYRWSDGEDDATSMGVARSGPTVGVRYRF